MTFLLGAAALFLLWYLSKAYLKVPAPLLADWSRKIGGGLAVGAAVFLAIRGRIDMAMLLGFFGAGLLGIKGFGVPSWAQRTGATPGATSTVRSVLLEMALDHDTGALSGTVVSGTFAGRRLDDLGVAELDALAAECRQRDPEGERLLDAYLDRRFPGRRQAAHDDSDARGAPRSRTGAMTEQEAYEILGLPSGAGEEDIRRAHRSLMKKLHPDQGGSTYLATRVNQAKDVLLNRHR